MDKKFNISTIDFGEPFNWKDVTNRLKQETCFRLPNAAEATRINFPYQAIWISDIIGESNAVMDREWGVQVVRSGGYGLILVER